MKIEKLVIMKKMMTQDPLKYYIVTEEIEIVKNFQMKKKNL